MEMVPKEGDVVPRVEFFKCSKRVLLKTILSREDRGVGLIGQRIVVGGWVKSSKEHKKKVESAVAAVEDVTSHQISPCFRNIMRLLVRAVQRRRKMDVSSAGDLPSGVYLQVNDGSCVSSLQLVVESSLAPVSQITPAGTSILAEGVLKVPSNPGKRVIELKVEKILYIGTVDLVKFPLEKTELSFEFIKNHPHLRPWKTMVASVTRIRSVLANATHTFFQNHGFLYVNMPVITSTNSEGCGEMFQVTTLFSKADSKATDDHRSPNLEGVKAAMKEKSAKIEELKRSDSNKEALAIAVQDLEEANKLALSLEAQEKLKPETSSKVETVDFTKDFFSQKAYLTVSSHLHLESYACALGSVYTFGPIFQADKSQTTRSLAESWLVELEIAFSELEDVMHCAENYLKFLCRWVLEHCQDDLKVATKQIDGTTIYRLQSVTSSSFERITYTQAMELLKKAEGRTFKNEIEWGINLTEEHESYLADEIFKKPVIIYDYPKEAKPFYVRLNDDGKTVAAMDIIIPKVGTLIRGSQSEERLDMISTRIQEFGLNLEEYQFYLDIRRHGSVQHSGFSLGFERMVMLATGVDNIRDVIPFPRSYGSLTC